MQEFATRKSAAWGGLLYQLTCSLLNNRNAVRIMKLTAILLLAGCLQLSAKGLSQTVSISVKDAPLLTVLRAIEKQTDFTFLVNPRILERAKPVTLTANNLPLLQVLDLCFKDQPLSYKIIANVINIVTKEEHIEKESFLPQTQNKDVSGRVVNENGEPVQAAIAVKGTTLGTTTNDNGEFHLTDIPENATLIFSGIGLETTEMKLGTASIMNVVVKISSSPLQETIIKGYYTISKKFNTSNVTKVKAEEISKQPVSDPIAALEGRVPGLLITQSKGAPGTNFNISLRGQNSIANNNNPLIVVDGVPFTSTALVSNTFPTGAGLVSPLNSLNPADIESIEILKDADATSIYGSRGANGVILITTKKGKFGGTSLNMNIYTGLGNVARKLDWMNTDQYLAMRHEALENDGLSVGNTDYDLNGRWDSTRYTDWQKVFIGGTSKVTDAQMSLSGGTGKTQFVFGSGYRKETTVFPGDYFDKKISMHFGLSHSSINDRLNFNLLTNYVNDNNQLPTDDLTIYSALAPNAPALYDANGNLNWQGNTFDNPFAIIQRRAKAITNNLISNATFSYKILNGLTFKTSVGYNNIMMKQNRLYPLSSYSPQLQQSTNRVNQMSTNSIQSWIVEPQLNYDKLLWLGKLDIIVGSTFQESKQDAISQIASNFSNDNLIENLKAATTLSTSNYTYSQYRYNAFYGRIGYIVKEKYIVNFTGRRDGSSRFGPGKQFGNFGAIGAAWIFSDEKFLKNNFKFLSFGKIRGSYGTTGNDQLTPYQYLSSFSSFSYSYIGLAGLLPTRLTNPDYRWEEIKKLEFGLELGFLDNRINLGANWYRNRTGNQLVGYPLASTTGFTSIQYNLPAVIQNNGLEFELNTTNIKTKNIKWATNFNLSIPRNKLISYPNLAGSSYRETYAVGQSLSVQYLFHYLGIDPATGLYTFEDINKDGTITYSSDRSFFFKGQDYYGGIQNNFSYKEWELSFLIQFVKQNGRSYTYNTLPGNFISGVGNQPISALQRWQKVGDEKGLIQKYTTIYLDPQDFFDGSSGRIEDASFARLKNLSLSWRAPNFFIQKTHLKSFRIYVQGQNLLTITKYKGIDPETAGGLSLPPIRMITAGVQLSL